MILSPGVPLSVFAEGDEAATGNEIYAILYDIREKDTSDHWNGYELVFQRGNQHDPDVTVTDKNNGIYRRVYVKSYSYDEFGTSILDVTDNNLIRNRTPWLSDTPNALGIAPTKSASERTIASLSSKISIKDKIKPESIAGWFCNCTSVSEIKNLENIDTSICTDMAFAFYEMYNIQKLDLHTFDTSNVERIDYFIYSSNKLEEVDVSGFDLRKVKSLTDFIHGGWKSSQGEWNMGKLSKVNLSGVDISEIRKIDRLVTYTKDLEELDISDLNPQSAYVLNNLFLNNRGLKKLKFGTFEVGKKLHPSGLAPGGYMYDINHDDYLSGSSTNDITTITFNGMFEGCIALEEVDFENFSFDFDIDTQIEYKDKKDSDKLKTTYLGAQFYRMFANCENLTSIKHIGNLFNINTTVWSTYVFRKHS